MQLQNFWFMNWKWFGLFEVEIPSLRILMEAGIEKTEWVQTRGQNPYATNNVTKRKWFVPMIRRSN